MTSYIGTELDVFAHARNWKKYWAAAICPYLRGDVLEVGAGIGSNTDILKSDAVSSWKCLEPDPGLVGRMQEKFKREPRLADCSIEVGTTATLKAAQQFDTAIYIDVLEHIAKDREELARASSLLRSRGTIVVLSPAHQWLYTAFDRAIGHERRYNRSILAASTPHDCTIVRLDYLDSVGMIASFANRMFLRQANPTVDQIVFWDRYLVPCSRFVDRLSLRKLGKSILAVWQKR
jgi:phospholipid N-methyltransferase